MKRYDKTLIFFLVSLVVFILFKIPYLRLPFYWDEAWSYAPAIYKMYQNGPSLLPNSLDPWFSRGHPLMFYFLSSGWATIFGFSVLSMHIFSLMISTVLLVAVYSLGNKYYGRRTGWMAALLLMSYHVFFVQSSFLLPEILLALGVTLSALSYVNGKKWLFLTMASVTLLTKETGIVIVPALLLFEGIQLFYALKNKSAKETIKLSKKRIKWIGLAVVPLVVFFLLQRVQNGWFLYPGHTELIELNLSQTLEKLTYILGFVFTDEKRWILLVITLFILVFSRLKEGPLPRHIVDLVVLYLSILVFFAFFSATNFFTLRYTLCVVPLWLLIVALLIDFFRINPFIKWCLLALPVLLNARALSKSSNTGDVSMGYADAVKVSWQAVKFLEKGNYYDKETATTFLMMYNLNHPEIGYLSSEKKMNASNNYSEESDFYIVTSWEGHEKYDEIKEKSTLIKRFSEKNAFVEIYENKF